MPFTLVIPPELDAELDALAVREQVSKSDLLLEGALKVLSEERRFQELQRAYASALV